MLLQTSMKNAVQCLPYEEVSLSFINNTTYVVHAPWLAMQTTIETSDETSRTLAAFAKQDFSQIDPKILSNFLSQLNLPFNYILPSYSSTSTDNHRTLPQLPISVQKLSKKQLREFLNLESSLADDSEWNWDADAILEFSKIYNAYDPAALLSVVRRFHLLDCTDKDQTGNLYDYCKTLSIDNNAIQKMLATIVYQNYYVTAECQNSLAPALSLSKSAFSKLNDFMDDEKGHDLLLLRALSALQTSPEHLYLSNSTKNIMSILKQLGSTSFLGFCLAIDFFEKPSFDEVDPLTELLRHFHHDIAASCLQKHKTINDDGGHECISLDLLSHMNLVDKDYALFAIRLSEVLTDEMTSVTADLLNLFKQQQTKQAESL